MRGLTIILTGHDPERMHAALSIAAAHAATGAKTRIFFEGRAVALLAEASPAPCDADRHRNGLPTLAEIRAESTHLGVALIACQGGMALAGLDIDQLGTGVEAGGLVGLMTNLGDDRLLAL
ncbi:MAG: DsrE family protein [Pseudomonadota bacterium]